MNVIRNLGAQFAGPFIFILVLMIPSELRSEQTQFLAIFSYVVYSWLFTKIPLFVTGFIGVSLTVLLGISPPVDVLSNFAHPIIFLFLGGFLLAIAFTKVGLDKRISLFLLTRDFIKGSTSRLLFSLMALTAVLTMWISNTATTAMMLPLVLGTLKSLGINNKKTISLILICIAYSSSIGGIATPIGSTPNIIAIGMLKELVNLDVTFFEWIVYALPLSIIFMCILFFLTNIKLKKENINFNSSFLKKEYAELPKISNQEIIVFIIFMVTIILWLIPSINKLFGINSSLILNSGAVALLCSSSLFLFPLKNMNKILNTADFKKVDWSSLMLFGSGLAIGKILFELELAQIASNALISAITQFGLFGIFLSVFTFVIFSTELTSNTASANILLPIMISLALQLKISPFFVTMGVSIACSLAFMLPIATPPNAIVYGSEKVDKADMFKLGFGLNIILSISLSVFIYLFTILSM